MKLSKIYANKTDFKPIVFNVGFNVIYGDVVTKIDDEGKAHPHNIGKTSLVELIDFMLLKGVDKKNFFGIHKDKFSDWVFYLEIALNSGKYLTIRRSVQTNSKISFKEHFAKDQNFVNETQWDYEDLSFGAKSLEERPIAVLSEYLNFDVVSDFPFRQTLGYFLRGQSDYRDIFRLDKFRGKDAFWKPALFSLLGFEANTLQKKYQLDEQRVEENKFLTRLQANGESEEIYKIRAAIDAKNQEQEELRKKVGEFDFFQKEQSVNYELVTTTEAKIADLNKERYNLDYKVEQIRKSLDSNNKAVVDFDEVKALFGEVKLYFPENLKQEYEAVSTFSKQISTERSKYLKQELTDAEDKLKSIRTQLIELNQERANMLSLLRQKDTFIKYQSYQDDIAGISAQIATFKAQLEDAQTVRKYQEGLEKTKTAISKLSTSIKEQIDQDNQDYTQIRQLFQSTFKEIMNYTALLVVQPNRENNVDFEVVVLDQAKDTTGKGNGHTATKTLCACFAIATLSHYSKKSFFRFAYHDGVYGDAGDNPRINLTKVAREYCDKYGIQYIVSAIASDFPAGTAPQEGEVRRTLTEKDTLFGIDF